MSAHVEYLWVHRRQGPRWLVSSWEGSPQWRHINGKTVTPDLELGRPVIRKIGSGAIAQHYRVESCPVLWMEA